MILRPTLAGPHRFEVEIKKSRFIAQAAPADAVAAAVAFVKAASDADARHNCWAYRIGDAYRSDDADEPSGTAGRPILAAIDGQGLDEVVVVVTRWFGGIKLGAGGLVRAYGGSAAECLRTAQRRERVAQVDLSLEITFAQLGVTHALLDASVAHKLEERFDARGVHLRVRLRADHSAGFQSQLRDATRGQARISLLDESAEHLAIQHAAPTSER